MSQCGMWKHIRIRNDVLCFDATRQMSQYHTSPPIATALADIVNHLWMAWASQKHFIGISHGYNVGISHGHNVPISWVSHGHPDGAPHVMGLLMWGSSCDDRAPHVGLPMWGSSCDGAKAS